MKIIAITGTKGKTTTAKFLTELISSRGDGCISIGTLGIEIHRNKNAIIEDKKCVNNSGENSEKALPKFYSYKGVSENTTPESYAIYEALDYAASLGISYAVIEASSIALESMRVWKIPFFMTMFTNLSGDHIGDGEHASFDEYKLAKRTLFTDYGAEIAVVNSDSPYASFMSAGVRTVIKVGKDLNSDFKYEYLGVGNSGAEFLLNGEAFEISAEGEFNAADAALALASAACLFEVDIKEFKDALAAVRLDGRFEIYEYHSRRIIIDFAHNAASFRAMLGYARDRYEGRIIVVFGSVGERNRRRRRELALAAEEYADVIIITSDNPGYEDPEQISAEIASNLSKNTISYRVTDRYGAILRAVDISLPGDTILLLGKGHESFQKIGANKLPFSERGIIMSLGARPLR